MKKFLFTASVFFAILWGLAIIADFVISNKLRKSTSWYLNVWNEIYSGTLQSDVLIMGSCAAKMQYDPRILDSIVGLNFYNIGLDGRYINSQLIRYDVYRRKNTKPKLIIHNIDMDLLHFECGKGYESEQFFPYFFDSSLKRAISKQEKFSFFEQYLPAYRYIGYKDLTHVGLGLRKKSIRWGNDLLYKGFYAVDWDRDFSKLESEYVLRKDSRTLHLFDDYLAKAYAEKIQVVFVYAPKYIELTNRIIDLKEMYELYDSIARKYNIPILDYTYHPISYDSTFFYFPWTLNRIGAELFSTQLAHDIDSLIHISAINF